jgi:hypothetical protein
MTTAEFIEKIINTEKEISMMTDHKKQQVMRQTLGALIGIVEQALAHAYEGQNFVLNYIGKRIGKQALSINLSIVENFDDNEYGEMMSGLAMTLNGMSEHYKQIKDKVDNDKKAQAEITKKEDGSVIIKFG